MDNNSKILLGGGMLGIIALFLSKKDSKSEPNKGDGGVPKFQINFDNVKLTPPDTQDGIDFPIPDNKPAGPGTVPAPKPAPVPKDDVPPEPEKEPEAPLGFEIADTPTPGSYYKIKYGDTLFGITSKAYKTKGGTAENLKAAKMINNTFYNKRFWHATNKLFPPTNKIISFLPQYSNDFNVMYGDSVNGGLGKGKDYAIIYIPRTDESPWV